MVLAVVGVEINRSYHNGVETVNENDVDLSLYNPFREDTLAASLDEPSTLSIADNPPRIDGATALYPLYSAFAKAVYPINYNAEDVREGDIEVGDGAAAAQEVDNLIVCSKTDGAYKRLIAGETDIIFVAGPSEGQLRYADEAGVEFKFTPIGREAFVFFVNAKNPINGLSINDIQRIYSGEVSDWREFGGRNSKIRAFQRPQDSGSQTALIQFMGNILLMTPPKEDIIMGMGEMISRAASYRNYDNAIGYSFLFFAAEMARDNKIKLLALDGVAPTRENVANKTYPYADDFYAVTAGTENPNAEIFIEWILSEQGQRLVGKTGYTPIYENAD
jgi:phosphate transport system substrate-binding protein